MFTPLAGLEVAVPGGDDVVLPVRDDFEYAVVAVDGSAVVAGALIAPGLLARLPAGLSQRAPFFSAGHSIVSNQPRPLNLG